MKSPYLSLARICNGQADWQKVTLSLCVFFLLGNLSAQTTFFQEDFETDGNGSRYTTSGLFIDADGSSEDYYGRVENVGGVLTYRGCTDDPIDITNPYSGQSGNFFFAGEDLDDLDGCGEVPGTSDRSLDFTDIIVLGASEITCRILIANGADGECGAAGSRWDVGEGLKVVYAIDGGPTTEGLCFAPDLECNVPGDDTNEPLHLDLNCDGDGEDGFLGNQFTEFSFTIPAGGISLDLSVEINADAADEEIAFDNIRLEAQTPPMEFVCPSTGMVTFDPPTLCDDEEFETCTISGVENLSILNNADTTFELNFIHFDEQPADPYGGGGDVLLALFNSNLVDGGATFPTSIFSAGLNEPGFLYVILNPAPTDPDCRPFAEFEIIIGETPEVESVFAGTVCEDFTQDEVVAALNPIGGVYSGPGVTDLGNGISYAFDASVNGPGTLLVNYTVTVDGCSGVGFDTIEIVALPEVSFVAEVDTVSIANGVQTSLGGGLPTGGIYSGMGVTDDGNGETFTFDPAAAGVGVFNVTYTITGDVFPNCSNQAIDSIEVVQVSSVTNFTQADLRVYPNPTSGFLAINVAKSVGNTMHYELTDLRGRLVTSGRLNTAETRIDLEAVTPGVYFLRVLDADSGNWLVKKIIRQ